MTARDKITGKFTRVIPDVDAESQSGPMGDDIPFDNVAGAPSPNTIDQPRHGPDADLLAQGWATRLEPRHPVLVAADEQVATLYGGQGARLRDAARLAGVGGPIGYALGLEPPAARSEPVQRRDGSGARLPSVYQRDVDPGDR